MGFRLNFDSKLGHKPGHYLIQSGIAGLMTMVFLSFLHLIRYHGIVAALGATTFMIFTMPHRVSTRPRYVIGGYLMGGLAGVLITFALKSPDPGTIAIRIFLVGALTVAIASLLMVVTNTEHPPAAGFALALILQPWDFKTLGYVLAWVCLLSVAKHYLKRFLIDLL